MSDIENDSDYDNLLAVHHELIRKGMEALDDMIEVARESEHPRAYEVYSKLLKDVSDMNNSLMDSKKKKKELSKENLPANNSKTTNNNILVASTTDLQRLLIKNGIKDVVPVEESDGITKQSK